MKDVRAKFADILRQYMNSNDLTQGELAARLNTSQSAVSMWLAGTRFPSTEKMVELSKILGIGTEWIAGDAPRMIPVLGQVGAGVPMYAEENVIAWEEISPRLEGDYFALKIHGDSMSPRMQDGDTVICKRQDTADDGDIVIALGGCTEALCKRLRLYKDGIELVSINPQYRPLSFSNEQIKSLPVQIIGKAVEVRGKL